MYSAHRSRANEIAFIGIVPSWDQTAFGPPIVAKNKNHLRIPVQAVM